MNNENRSYHKNWPEICRLAKVNQMLMVGLATLDLSKPEAQVIASCLPQLFTDREIQGPVPLSVLKHEEMRVCDESRVYYISQKVALSLGIPAIKFGDAEEGASGPIPPEFNGEHWESMVDTVEWNGQKFLVLMDQDIAGDLILAPLECIDVNS